MVTTARLICLAAAAGALAWSPPAQARFGKRSEPASKEEHTAQSASGDSGSSSAAGGSSGPSATSQARRGLGFGLAHPALCGFWSGAFVPWFGYGYRLLAEPLRGTEPAPLLEEEGSAARLVAGVESLFFAQGFTLGASVTLELGDVGLSVYGANIAARADDGTSGWDHLQHVSGRVTYAFLTGRRGRWKAEAGADAVFAPDLVVIGPTLGTSAVVWVVGPLAAEGSAHWTFWPFDQLDLKLGLALGLGPLGLRAGWRFQLLSDRGLVDQVVHTDIFTGPYVGVGLAI